MVAVDDYEKRFRDYEDTDVAFFFLLGRGGLVHVSIIVIVLTLGTRLGAVYTCITDVFHHRYVKIIFMYR